MRRDHLRNYLADLAAEVTRRARVRGAPAPDIILRDVIKGDLAEVGKQVAQMGIQTAAFALADIIQQGAAALVGRLGK